VVAGVGGPAGVRMVTSIEGFLNLLERKLQGH